MQRHEVAFVVDAPPHRVWRLFHPKPPPGATVPRTFEHPGGSITILREGDDDGAGLVRTCTFAVPRWLLSGGVARSWEVVTEARHEGASRPKPLWRRLGVQGAVVVVVVSSGAVVAVVVVVVVGFRTSSIACCIAARVSASTTPVGGTPDRSATPGAPPSRHRTTGRRSARSSTRPAPARTAVQPCGRPPSSRPRLRHRAPPARGRRRSPGRPGLSPGGRCRSAVVRRRPRSRARTRRRWLRRSSRPRSARSAAPSCTRRRR